MGLAGRKQKQRIPADPRNLSWADDASRFGLSYLSKFGWDASQGLGASGEGLKTHIKVQQKLDMMGIGAQHQQDPNGIAWKQNKDFEALLKRLNESVEQEGGIGVQDDETELEIRIGGKTFVGAQEKAGEKSRDDASLQTVKKRKHRDGTHPYCGDNVTRKKRKEKDRHQDSDSDISSDPAVNPNPLSAPAQSSSDSHSNPMSKPRPMAHRARIRAAKRIADKSASAISEILGIAPSPSVSTLSPTPPSPPSTTQPSSLSLDNLTTSAKSVADYFKEKFLAYSTTSSPLPSGSTTPGLGTTRLGIRSSHTFPSEEGEPQRKGLGSPTVPPFSQMSRPRSVSENGGDDAHDQDTTTEKMRGKAERKAEKRKRREAEAAQPIREGSIKQTELDHTESVEKTSKEKRKKRRKEHNKQAHVDGEGIVKKHHKHKPPVGPRRS